MPVPEVGKQYKFYKGGIFEIIAVEDDNICMQSKNSQYHISLDFWNMPALVNDTAIYRFTEHTKKTKAK